MNEPTNPQHACLISEHLSLSSRATGSAKRRRSALLQLNRVALSALRESLQANTLGRTILEPDFDDIERVEDKRLLDVCKRRLQTTLGREPSQDEVAAYAKLPAEPVPTVSLEASREEMNNAMDPMCHVQRKELRRLVASLLSSLDSVEQKIIKLHFLEGLSLSEIGLAIGATEKYVNETLGAALENLRECVKTQKITLAELL